MQHCPILKRPRHNALSILLRRRGRRRATGLQFLRGLCDLSSLLLSMAASRSYRGCREMKIGLIRQMTTKKKSIGWIADEIFQSNLKVIPLLPLKPPSHLAAVTLIFTLHTWKMNFWIIYSFTKIEDQRCLANQINYHRRLMYDSDNQQHLFSHS